MVGKDEVRWFNYHHHRLFLYSWQDLEKVIRMNLNSAQRDAFPAYPVGHVSGGRPR